MIILIESPQQELVKCTSCFQITEPAAYHPVDKRRVCKSCVAKMRPILLSPRDWLVYQTMKSLNSNSNYLVLTARKLKIAENTVRAIACNLDRKGLRVRYCPKKVKVDGQMITETQHLILKTVLSDKYLIDACYAAKSSKELSINKHTFLHHLEILKSKGFNIPTSEERAKNLEKYILQQMQTTSKPRSEFIKHIASTTGFKRTTILHLVKKLEDENFRIKRGFATERIIEILQNQSEIIHTNLYKLMPEYHTKTVLDAVQKLRKEKKIKVTKYHAKKIVLKLAYESKAV